MLKYPDRDVREKDEKSLLQELINGDNVKVGDRVAICHHPCTCIHIDNNDYFFSFDEIFAKVLWDDIVDILTEIYNTGLVYNKIAIFDKNTLKDIDYLFIPDTYQLFGTEGEKNKDKHFTWYKRYGNLARVKGDYLSKKLIPYWTSNDDTFGYGMVVSSTGQDDYIIKTDDTIGVPVFFKMHKEV
jgi:hypothetical protein